MKTQQELKNQPATPIGEANHYNTARTNFVWITGIITW